MRLCACRKAKGAVLVYDISDPKSLAAIDRWKSELQDQGDPDLLMMLVGNKSDLEGKRKVSRTEGEANIRLCMHDRSHSLPCFTKAFPTLPSTGCSLRRPLPRRGAMCKRLSQIFSQVSCARAFPARRSDCAPLHVAIYRRKQAAGDASSPSNTVNVHGSGSGKKGCC